MALDDDIQIVNRWADYVAATPQGKLNPTSLADKLLRREAIRVLEKTQDWPTIEERDGQHMVLQAPDGSHVLYSYEQEGDQFVERLGRTAHG